MSDDFDVEKAFKDAEDRNRYNGYQDLHRAIDEVFDNNVLLTPEENMAIAVDMLYTSLGIKHPTLIGIWYAEWLTKRKV